MMMNVNELTFGYKRKKPLYEGLAFTLEAGKIYGLLGENGTGKSTLLYLLTGLLHPQSSSVIYKDADTRYRMPEQLSAMYLIPEEVELPKTKLSSYVDVYAPLYPNFSQEVLTHCLRSFGLEDDQRLNALSMGQKKKVIISFALASGVPLILMDEPTNGLDIPGKSIFRQLIAETQSDERILLISTHQAADIDRMLDEVIILDNRGIRLNDSVAHICSRLRFVEQAVGNEQEQYIIYKQPNAGGYSLVLHNENEQETQFNLELLFNALRSNPEAVITALIETQQEIKLNTEPNHEKSSI